MKHRAIGGNITKSCEKKKKKKKEIGQNNIGLQFFVKIQKNRLNLFATVGLITEPLS